MTKQHPTPPKDRSRVRSELDKAMNTPSVNPRYGGLTPIEFIKQAAKTEQSRKQKRSKPDFQV